MLCQESSDLKNSQTMSDPEAHWTKDNFLSDFLLDTEQKDGEPDDAVSFEGTDLELMLADDASLSSYLSGDMNRPSGRGDRVTSVSNSSTKLSPEHPDLDVVLLISDDESSTTTSSSTQLLSVSQSQSQRPVVVTKTHSGKGNTNSNTSTSHSRQAIAARQNRQKKKQYLFSLEGSVQKLCEENDKLKNQDAEQKEQIAELKAEVMYLKSVIANQSVLSHLLKNIQNTNGVKLSASLLAETDENSQLGVTIAAPGPRPKRKLPSLIDGGNSESKVTSSSSSQDVPIPAKRSRPVSSKAVPSNQRHQLRNMYQNLTVGVNSELNVRHRASLDGIASKTVQVDIDGDGGNDSGLGGICLHVLGDSVSVEFCSSCNRSAAKSSSADHAYVKVC